MQVFLFVQSAHKILSLVCILSVLPELRFGQNVVYTILLKAGLEILIVEGFQESVIGALFQVD